MLATLLPAVASEPCLEGDGWKAWSSVFKHTHEFKEWSSRFRAQAANLDLRVKPEEALYRTITGEATPAVPLRQDASCVLAVHEFHGLAASQGKAPVVVHQHSAGLSFDSDLKVGDIVPLGQVEGATYSFQARGGITAALLTVPLLTSESDELYERLKKPNDEL